MASFDITQTSYTETASKVSDYSVSAINPDKSELNKETYWTNENYAKYFGYYKTIPEFKTAINAFATWVLGQGFETDVRTKIILENIDGWGEDTFLSILWNMLVMKKVQGDAYAEIIRDEKTNMIINLKPLGRLKHVTNKKGRIIRYEEIDGEKTKFKPNEILHFCNERVASEPHGTSITESVLWVIDSRNEAMSDWRRILHRSTIRIMYINEDDKSKMANMKRDYAEAIKKGELLLIPAKKGEAEFEELSAPSGNNHLSWIMYLENFFYQALGMPKVILGGTAENTEAAAKISTIVFEPIFVREIKELENDLWNQLGVKISINKQPSLMDNMQTDEMKNTGQIGFQANDTQADTGAK